MLDHDSMQHYLAVLQQDDFQWKQPYMLFLQTQWETSSKNFQWQIQGGAQETPPPFSKIITSVIYDKFTY